MSQNNIPSGIVDINIDQVLFSKQKKQGFNFNNNNNNSNSLFSIRGTSNIDFKQKNKINVNNNNKVLLNANTSQEYELFSTKSKANELILYFNPKTNSYTLSEVSETFEIKETSPPPPPILQPLHTSDNDEIDQEFENIPQFSPSQQQQQQQNLLSSSPLPPPISTNLSFSSSPPPPTHISPELNYSSNSSPPQRVNNNNYSSPISQPHYSSSPRHITQDDVVNKLEFSSGDDEIQVSPRAQNLPDIQYDDDDDDSEFNIIPPSNRNIEDYYEDGNASQESFDMISPYNNYKSNESSPQNSPGLPLPNYGDDQSSDRGMSFDNQQSPAPPGLTLSSSILNVMDTSGVVPSSSPVQQFNNNNNNNLYSSPSENFNNDSPVQTNLKNQRNSSNSNNNNNDNDNNSGQNSTSFQVDQMFSSDD